MKRLATLAGPLAFAAANFAALVILQQTLGPAEFGLFGFIQITIATGMGLINGVFGTPLTIAIAGPNDENQRAVVGSFLLCFLVFLVVGAACVVLATAAAGANALQLILVTVATALMWVRWFARSLDLALGGRGSAAGSDLSYAGASAATLAALLAGSGLTIELALAIQAVACLVSLLPMARSVAFAIGAFEGATPKRFRDEFQSSGMWSSLLVATTAVVANIHAYAVTLLFGSAAFAPIALATLLFRPHGVVLTGLITFERPRMAASARSGNFRELVRDVLFMHGVLIATWIGTSLTVLAILSLFREQALGDRYNLPGVIVAASLTSAIVLQRSLREPIVAALQAQLLGKQAAAFSLAAAATTTLVTAVALLLLSNEPSWSLLGTLAGETAFLICACMLFVRSQPADGTKTWPRKAQASTIESSVPLA